MSRKELKFQSAFDKDLSKLKQLIPGMNTSGKDVSHVEVIEEANRYIEKLHSHLVCQIRTHGFPDKLKSHAGRSTANDSNDDISRAIKSFARKNP
uniref:BHLH domain-containing protein n=1 Tax=Lepeophtheirus salmonis TaxID=72036 RepID=A0A0K2UU30_LEPSM